MKYGKNVSDKDGEWIECFTENAKDVFMLKDVIKDKDRTYNKDLVYKYEQQPILVRASAIR